MEGGREMKSNNSISVLENKERREKKENNKVSDRKERKFRLGIKKKDGKIICKRPKRHAQKYERS